MNKFNDLTRNVVIVVYLCYDALRSKWKTKRIQENKKKIKIKIKRKRTHKFIQSNGSRNRNDRIDFSDFVFFFLFSCFFCDCIRNDIPDKPTPQNNMYVFFCRLVPGMHTSFVECTRTIGFSSFLLSIDKICRSVGFIS